MECKDKINLEKPFVECPWLATKVNRFLSKLVIRAEKGTVPFLVVKWG
jgi:hypothetical protein